MNAAYLDRCLAVIARAGWMVQAVAPHPGQGGHTFCYTVGLTAAGLPEVIVAGLPVNTGHTLCNTAAQLALAGELRPGTTNHDIANYPLRIESAPAAPIITAERLYGENQASAVQLIWPDPNGFYPGDLLWSLRDAQPIYRLTGISHP
jgi:hypothetical protein